MGHCTQLSKPVKMCSFESNSFKKAHSVCYELRHVMLPKEIVKLVPKTHLMSEAEWRSIGVQQSQGWVHYMKHDPEPHILLFRRPLPQTNCS